MTYGVTEHHFCCFHFFQNVLRRIKTPFGKTHIQSIMALAFIDPTEVVVYFEEVKKSTLQTAAPHLQRATMFINRFNLAIANNLTLVQNYPQKKTTVARQRKRFTAVSNGRLPGCDHVQHLSQLLVYIRKG